MQKKVIIVLVGILLLGGAYALWQYHKDKVFNVSAARIAEDLDGKTANVAYGQVWPFDPTQNLSVKVLGKKHVDEYVVVMAELTATAKVDHKDAKEKLPSKVNLKGIAKLTYENIANEWYLVGVEGVTLRAVNVQ